MAGSCEAPKGGEIKNKKQLQKRLEGLSLKQLHKLMPNADPRVWAIAEGILRNKAIPLKKKAYKGLIKSLQEIKSEDELKALKDKGGVMGAYAGNELASRSPSTPTIPTKVKTGVALGLAALGFGIANNHIPHLPSDGISQSPTNPETNSPIQFNGIAQEQIAKIDEIALKEKLTTEQKQFLKDAVNIMMQQDFRDYAEKNHIRLDVMLAQAIRETGWGKSILANEARNYYGMKAPADWPEDKVYLAATSSEPDPTKQVRWRKYATMREGFYGYIDNMVSKDWYKDARANYNDLKKYISGIQNELDEQGNVRVAGKLAWAADTGYEAALMKHINDYKLTDLLNPVVVAPSKANGIIGIDLSKYDKKLWQYDWILEGEDAYTMFDLDGDGVKEKIRFDQIGQNQELRYKIINSRLKDVRISAELYEQWKKERFHDISEEVKARGYSRPFDGDLNGLGHFSPTANIPFVLHITSTRTSVDGRTGIEEAYALKNNYDKGHVGTVYYIPNDKIPSDLHMSNETVKGAYQLTHDPVGHIQQKSGIFTNRTAVGCEVAAGDMGGIDTQQYQDLVNLIMLHLENHTELRNGKSVNIVDIVNRYVKGHAETDAGLDGAHGDFKTPIADQVRALVIALGKDLGYNTGTSPVAYVTDSPATSMDVYNSVPFIAEEPTTLDRQVEESDMRTYGRRIYERVQTSYDEPETSSFN